jgi:hypothetical protein
MRKTADAWPCRGGPDGVSCGPGNGNAARCAILPTIPHLLRDLGLSREQALEQADKPFWR